jgi:hypothetical protein
VVIELHRAPPSFYLNAYKDAGNTVAPGEPNSVDYDVQIVDLSLHVKKVYLSSTEHVKIETRLLSETIKYDFNRLHYSITVLPSGITSKTIDNLFGMPVMPKRVTIFMIDNDAFDGNYQLNPFNFQHYQMRRLVLYRDGEVAKTIETTFSDDPNERQTMRAYHNLHEMLKISRSDVDLGISMEDFWNGTTLWMADLSCDQDASNVNYLNPNQAGDIRVELEFAAQLSKPVSFIAQGEFDYTLSMNRERIFRLVGWLVDLLF